MRQSLGAKPYVCTTPVWLIGTYDQDGKANVMAASWCGVCCSDPPCVAVSLRKATHTFASISARKAFTVSIPGEKHMREADFCGIASGRNHDKFKEAGLTPIRSELVDAPYVKEFPVVLECRVLHVFSLGLHTQFVGEILDVKAERESLNKDGFLDAYRVRPFFYIPGQDEYCGLGEPLGGAFKVSHFSAAEA